MSQKNVRLFILTVLTAIFLFFLIPKNFLPGLIQKNAPDKHINLLKIVAEYIRTSYVENPNPVKTMKGAFRGLISSLDPLSSYLDPANVKKYQKMDTANFKEPGIVVLKKSGTYPMVIGVVEDSPAEKAGIKIGDYLSELDGQPLLMLSMQEVHLYLKKTQNTPAKIKILRQEESEEIIIERKLLYNSCYSYSHHKNTGGILKIHHLFPPCADIIEGQLLPRLISLDKPLIVDLRNCHEGEIEEAVKLINLFLQADKVGYFQDKKGAKHYLSCSRTPALEHLPLRVWTNQATMGPAEVAAGVLKTFKRALIIGKNTPGLAAKQIFFPLEDGSGLLLTSEIFSLAKGNELWQKGIEPDKEIDEKNPNTERYLTITRRLFPYK